MFAILDVKSAYSFNNGTMSIEEIIVASKEKGYSGLAINDLNNLFNVLEFYKLAKKHDIFPIFSMRTIIDKITYLLYCKNDEGYLALIDLASKLSDKQFKLTLENLAQVSENLVIVVYGEGGIIEDASINTIKYLQFYQKHFTDFYIGISNNHSSKWQSDNEKLKKITKANNIKTVALPKVEFNKKTDKDIKVLFEAMAHNRLYFDHNNYVNDNQYFLEIEEIKKYYDQEDIDNTIEIANKCQVNFNTLEKAQLPQFKNDYNLSSEEFLYNLSLAGLKRRLNNQVSETYLKRLKYELKIINEMNFANYFLIIYDIVLFAKKQDILVGPARGSSASSLVAYSLGITNIDPIQYDLLFERFLNPKRITMPDIDIDFEDEKRSKVIDYVFEKYGSKNCSYIITFSTYAAKMALREVGKRLNIPSYKIDNLIKNIRNNGSGKLKDIYKSNNRFAQMISNDDTLKLLFKLANKIEGLPRHTSIHAAGIIIGDKELTNYIPLLKLNEDHYVSQYSMEYLESIGLIKMDLLGLKNLTIIKNIEKTIDNFNINNISLNDYKVYNLLSKGDTLGIFQLESFGMQNLLRQLKPQQFSDIVVAVALYRPGPMQNIQTFLKRRNKLEEVTYINKILEPILKDTYGIIVYQEQIMQIASKMANFSYAEADLLRKAISDKDFLQMKTYEEKFIQQSVYLNNKRKDVQQVYNYIERFADYGFNKAHSVAYATIAYQMAYLKVNYKKTFYVQLLNSVLGNSSKIMQYVLEAKKENIKVFKPNINISNDNFIEYKDGFLFPLTAISGVSKIVSRKIIEERNNGNYLDFFDLVARLNILNIKKEVIENLIYANALEDFGFNQSTLINNLDSAFMYANLVKIDSDEVSLDFDIVSKPTIVNYKNDEYKQLENEKMVLGMYLSVHPIVSIKEQLNLNQENILLANQLKKANNLLVLANKIKLHRSKNGYMMAFVSAMDESGSIDLVIMPNIYSKIKDELKINSYYLIRGRIERENSILVDNIKLVERS